jgi:hypothetical protein
MVMMAIVMVAYYLYLKKVDSVVCLFISVALKLMTIFIPVFFVGWQRVRIVGHDCAFLLVASQREILGYVVWPCRLYASAVSEWALTPAPASLGLLLTYAPFLYTGNYDPPLQTIKFWVMIIPVIFCFARFSQQSPLIEVVNKKL